MKSVRPSLVTKFLSTTVNPARLGDAMTVPVEAGALQVALTKFLARVQISSWIMICSSGIHVVVNSVDGFARYVQGKE